MARDESNRNIAATAASCLIRNAIMAGSRRINIGPGDLPVLNTVSRGASTVYPRLACGLHW